MDKPDLFSIGWVKHPKTNRKALQDASFYSKFG